MIAIGVKISFKSECGAALLNKASDSWMHSHNGFDLRETERCSSGFTSLVFLCGKWYIVKRPVSAAV
jgi:hypothetical protein